MWQMTESLYLLFICPLRHIPAKMYGNDAKQKFIFSASLVLSPGQ